MKRKPNAYPIPDILPALRVSVCGFNQMRQREQLGLQRLVVMWMTGKRRHKDSDHGENAAAFGKDFLRRTLGANYQAVVRAAFYRPEGLCGYSPGLTKKSVLLPHVERAVIEHLAETEGDPLVNGWTGRPVSSRVQGSAVYRSDVNRNPAKSLIRDLTPLVTINVDGLRTLAGVYRSWLSTGALFFDCPLSGRRLTLGQVQARFNQCVVLIRLAGAVTGEDGVLIQRYEEQRNARLLGVGAHLQGMSREVRAVALGFDATTVDRDLDAAHPRALYHLALSGGYDAGATLEYVENKSDIRRAVALDISAPVRQVKEALTAIFYGAHRSTHYKAPLFQTFGGRSETVRQFIEHPSVKPLFDERSKARDAVLASAEYNGGRIRNAMRRERRLYEDGKKVSKWGLLSHQLTGVEALATQTAVLETFARGGNVSLLCFDGWVSDNSVDVEVLQEAVLRETGVPFSISSSPLSIQLYLD
ncbi:hypothetical protein [Rubrivirga sp. IMCC45206]|uniref:hypothetical protein n=1 Tax=Rubrivirga sp. IMCC45206 TaxID=3391614 RepID=UPI00398FAD05